LVKVGRIHTQLETQDEARAAYNEALTMYRQLLKDQPDRLELKAGETACLGALGDYSAAIEGWEDLVGFDPANNKYRSELAQAYNSLANSQVNAQQVSEALAAHQKARDLCMLLVTQEPMNPAYLYDLGQTLNNIGAILDKQGLHEDALALYREAARYGETARTQAPAVLKYGSLLTTALGNIGDAERALGWKAEALAAYQQRAEVSRSLAMRNPAVPSLQKSMFDAFRYLAVIQRELNQPEDAARSLRQARELMDQLPRETADDWYVYAQVKALCAAPPSGDDGILPEDARDREARQQDADEAVAALRAAIEKGFNSSLLLNVNSDPSFAALRGRDDFHALVDQLTQLARLTEVEQQNNDKANLSVATNVAEALAKLSAADPQNALLLASYARSRHAVGLARLGLGELAEAETSLDEALRIARACGVASPGIRRPSWT
jgi:tetratricopeptide (TPR) repeat protein